MTYSEKLRDPRWQRKRLEVCDAVGWKCEDCGAKDKTLNVHHCFYIKGLEPWEYEIELLMCLDEECHQRRQALEQQGHIQLASEMRRMPIVELESFVWGPIAMKAKRDHVSDSGELP